MSTPLKNQNEIALMHADGEDLSPRWQAILKTVTETTGFQPDDEFFSQSKWWDRGEGSKVGAVHISGTIDHQHQRQPAILKIQGTQPNLSEAEIIQAFQNSNQSQVIRPPHLYAHLPWNQADQFEALILERIEGQPALTQHPAPESELNHFLDLYQDYRANCRHSPWVAKPQTLKPYSEYLTKWRAAASVADWYKSDSLKLPSDEQLVTQATHILEKQVSLDNLEFVQGHFESGSFLITNQGEVVMFSNLFWSWRMPFYDIVFAYHWWMLGMEHAPTLTPESLEQERHRWLDRIFNLSEIKNHPQGTHLVNLALLERAVPALLVDRSLLKHGESSEQIITTGARDELQRLIQELS